MSQKFSAAPPDPDKGSQTATEVAHLARKKKRTEGQEKAQPSVLSSQSLPRKLRYGGTSKSPHPETDSSAPVSVKTEPVSQPLSLGQSVVAAPAIEVGRVLALN